MCASSEPHSREQELDVVHHLLGLAGRVADRDGLAGVEILRHLAAQVDRVAGDHRLAEVVAELLLRDTCRRC